MRARYAAGLGRLSGMLGTIARSGRKQFMSNYDPNSSATGTFADRATAVDAGLRAHMLRVYNYMAVGFALTGLVAMLTYRLTSPELLQSPLMWVFMLAPLALVFFSMSIPALRSR